VANCAHQLLSFILRPIECARCQLIVPCFELALTDIALFLNGGDRLRRKDVCFCDELCFLREFQLLTRPMQIALRAFAL
jgi:hypothetical protein